VIVTRNKADKDPQDNPKKKKDFVAQMPVNIKSNKKAFQVSKEDE